MPRYDKLIIKNSIDDYLKGLPIKDICEKYGISDEILYYHLKKTNISNRKNIVTEEVIQKALNDYQKNNLSATKCSEKYSIGRTTLFRAIKKYNIKKNIIKIQHQYNKDIFESINSEEKAYWLGFIYADGCVSKERQSLEIALKADDKEHILKFIKFIGGDKKMLSFKQNTAIKDGKLFDIARVTVTCKKMYEDLLNLEVYPRKSQITIFPNFLENKFIKHFIRGYFDGDGCITCSPDKKGIMYYQVSLIATNPFCNELMNILETQLITKVKLLDRHNKMFIWAKRGTNQIRIFLNYLYKDATIYLDRKYIKYLEFCRLKQ